MNNGSNKASLPGTASSAGFWLEGEEHREWLSVQSKNLFNFFAASKQSTPGFSLLAYDGSPLKTDVQELHTTTRLVHSYSLGVLQGFPGADAIVDHGMTYLTHYHKDPLHGGYVWSVVCVGIKNFVSISRAF